MDAGALIAVLIIFVVLPLLGAARLRYQQRRYPPVRRSARRPAAFGGHGKPWRK